MDFTARLKAANSRLRAANCRTTIESRGGKLVIRATLPPKPGSRKIHDWQQRISLGLSANPAGLKLAEAEAKRVDAALGLGTFSWDAYAKNDKQDTIASWITRFEQDYWERRERNPRSELTWRSDYLAVFRHLPPGAPLTIAVLENAILQKPPGTRVRQRWTMVCTRLAKFAGLTADFSQLKGDYSSRSLSPRDLPTDAAIAQWREMIQNPSWQWAFGAIAVWGLRNHEIFYLDLADFPLARVTDGKTGSRLIYPLFPEWADRWQLAAHDCPNCTGRDNAALGHRVSTQFRRYGVPFRPYDLRHAWAVRAISFRLPLELAAQQMGHSVTVHCQTYHRWISDDFYRVTWERLMSGDRPGPPNIPEKSFTGVRQEPDKAP